MLPHNLQFEAIGTKWQIETVSSLPSSLVDAIHTRIEAFDQTYSRFRPDSLIRQVAHHPGAYQFPDDSITLFNFYRTLYDLTNGQVTPLIGMMLEKAGYDAAYSFTPRQQTTLPSWEQAMDWRGNILTTTQSIVIDVGAAGKGYLVDEVSSLLDAADIKEYVIDASGDIRHRGVRENIVGLENPFDATEIIGSISVQNQSVCASATNRRKWGSGLHHIFNPHTMKPTFEIVATWVIAEQTMIADGLATALFFVPPEQLREAFQFEYVRMHYNGSLEYSPRFKEGIFV
jgi:thiamine biosynthesis lipoprotein